MTHGSLFSGIGGFDLAAEWMGWENKFHCEWNEFGKKVLKYYWPEAESFDDITKTDFTKYYGTIDIISGGFPCQPYSSAGKRLGKADERHLWPHMLRAITEIAPRWVVGENVRGLTTWNGGLVFHEVCADLENLGYQVASYIIPAVAVNAPHKRERIWFVAYRNASDTKFQGLEGLDREWKRCTINRDYERLFVRSKNEFVTSDSDRDGFHKCDSKYEIDSSEGRINAFNDIDTNDDRRNVTDTNNKGLQGGEINGDFTKKKRQGQFYRDFAGQNCGTWENFPSQSPICGGDDGLPTELDGITFSKWRKQSLMAYGNAVVPQVVFQIFKAMEQYELLHNS